MPILPPSRADRLRSMVVLLGLLAVFAGVAAAVDALRDEPTTVTTAAAVPNDDASADPPPVGAGEMDGQFRVSGSSTVFPIVQLQAERFESVEPGVGIAVEGQGSGDGAQLFCRGEVPIANASRLYKEEELEICAANGIEFIELRRGIDGITVITSPRNDAIECVSFNDLYALLSGEASGFDSWSDANALTATWGGQTFPDVPLDVFGPGEESGTFDSFSEIVIESVVKGKTGLEITVPPFSEELRPDYASSPDDNTILAGIGGSDFSLGWVGFAFASEAAEAGEARMLQVSENDGGPCVTPTAETIASAAFPIARFLYTYVNANEAASRPEVAAFVDYMMSDEGLAAVAEVGYIDLAPPDQTRAQVIWDTRTTGRQWG